MNKNLSPVTICLFTICSMIIPGLFIFSCSEPAKKNNYPKEKKSEAKPAIIKKPGSSFLDTIMVDSKSAVFYNPDSLQMGKIKAVNEHATFAMITHDCFYQMQNARIVLKKYWPQIKVIETSKARYLLFVKGDHGKVCIDLNNKNDICGLFIFDREKDPMLVDMPNINTVLGFYFKK